MGIDLFETCDLISNEDFSEIEIEIVIDQKFAKRLEYNKKREALHRLQDLKKRGIAGDSSESSDESDEEDDLADSRKDLKFYDALLKVKKQDPILHQKGVEIFSDEEDGEEKPRAVKKEKPLYLKDVMAKHLIEEGPEFEDKPLKHDSKIYRKEQSDDIRAFLEAEKAALGSDEDDFIKVKETAVEEGGEDSGEIDKRLDEIFPEELNENENFLKNYLSNKMWINREGGRKPIIDEVDVSEDEDELEKQERYEARYNFRYEEAEQGDRVLGHSRFVEGSVRKKTSSRALQRKSKEERMAQAELKRKEELKHLKNLKKKEIQQKLEKIRAIAGIGEDGVCMLDEDDLEEDFNKEDELLGLPKDWWGVCERKEGFASARERVLKMKEEREEPQKEEGKRKRKRKISLKEKVALDKEYYKLDYEDTIDDLKTRFKYKSVPSNKYGLLTEEILMADDKNLNQYVSLKKLAPYMPDEWEVMPHQKSIKNLILGGEKSDTGKVSKKHLSKAGQGYEEATRKTEQEGSIGGLSRNRRRRRQIAELKPSLGRLGAYQKLPFKARKKH